MAAFQRKADVVAVVCIVVGGTAVLVWQLKQFVLGPSFPGTIISSSDHDDGVIRGTELPSLATNPDRTIYNWLQGDDPQERARAVEALRDMARRQPNSLAEDLQRWLTSLLDAGLYEEVLQLTERATPLHASNMAAVSDYQEARVRALLALGENERALSEAKSAFNVATQKTAHRAIELTIAALEAAGADPAAVDQLKQQIVGAEAGSADDLSGSILAAIHVDPAIYESALQRLPASSGFENLLARGNLLLLADRPIEAQEAFIDALRTSEARGKNLFAALEGVVRAERAHRGSIREGNAMVTAMRFGAVASAHLSALGDLDIETRDLQTAGQRIPIAELPESLGPLPAVSHEQLAASVNLSGRMQRPMEIVKGATPPDPQIERWLEQFDRGEAVSDEARKEMVQFLEQTPLNALSLFDLARAFHQATDDKHTSSLFYGAAAQRAHQVLEAEGTSENGLEILHAILEYRQDYKDVLWDQIEWHQNKEALNALCTIYSILVTRAPREDPVFSAAVASVSIGLSECQFLLYRTDDALETLRDVDVSALSSLEKLHWTRAIGFTLYADKQYAEALPFLKEITARPDYRHAPQAAYYLTVTLLELARPDEASTAYEHWKASYRDVTPARLVRQLEIKMYDVREQE
jgi:hypothetical protein